MSAAVPMPDELLAAELAFGLADRDERIAAMARLERDPAFAAVYDMWLARAVALIGTGQEVPGPAVWQAIHARLPSNDAGAGGASRAQLRRWRAATFAAAAAAMIAVTVAATIGWRAAHRPDPVVAAASVPPPIDRPLVATLTGADRRAVVAVSFVPGSGRLATMPNGVRAGRRATELWVIPTGGQPHAIGVIPSTRPAWIAIPAVHLRALGLGATLAISLEPVGGSPTGRPTGPVILTGAVASVS